MTRLLIVLALLAAATAGAAWVADRPGTVALDWLGESIELTTTEALIVAGGALICAVVLLDLVRGLILAPRRLSRRSAARRRERGLEAVSDGLVAVAAGDGRGADRALRDATRLLPDEALTGLLQAQRAQMLGDAALAEERFAALSQNEATRVLGIRGLHMEALRRGDLALARSHARAANALDPSLAWAATAALEAAASQRDWDGALSLLEAHAKAGRLDKAEQRRLRAVLLTARAQARAEAAPDLARKDAAEAHGLAKDLIPAALIAGELTRAKNRKQAQALLEEAYRLAPHPSLFAALVKFDGELAAADALARARTVAALAPSHEESAIGLARAALAAREVGAARDALGPLLEGRPAQRVCLLMAEIEAAGDGEEGRVREWLARAVRAPRDPAWVADGVAFADWQAVSPVSGRLDRFEWRQPPGGEGDALGPSVDLTALRPGSGHSLPRPTAQPWGPPDPPAPDRRTSVPTARGD